MFGRCVVIGVVLLAGCDDSSGGEPFDADAVEAVVLDGRPVVDQAALDRVVESVRSTCASDDDAFAADVAVAEAAGTVDRLFAGCPERTRAAIDE